VHVICGAFWGKTGPVEGVAADPQYLDVWVPPGVTARLPVDRARHVFAYVFDGSGEFAHASDPRPVLTERVDATGAQDGYAADNRSLVVFDAGDDVTVQAGDNGIRFVMASGRPLQEPIAWRGPIVMNTNEELRTAFEEFRDGTFLKHR
jgi:redox-sensitive bicupin YhaK (pirin superfamily)